MASTIPPVEDIACHYTVPEKGGLSGALGLAEQNVRCWPPPVKQYRPIKFKDKFSPGDVVFGESR